MTAQYPPASGDVNDDTPGQDAADLSYADVVSPPPAQIPDEQAPGETDPPEPVAGVVRTYSWPTSPSPQPVESSEVDSADALAAVSTMDTEPAVDQDQSTVDSGGTVSEVEPAPSMVDGSEPATRESVQAPEAAAPHEEAESEPEDPAVTRMRAVQGRLGELDELPIGEHPARYEELHAELAGALAQIDRAPDSQA